MRFIKRVALGVLYLAALIGVGTAAMGCGTVPLASALRAERQQRATEERKADPAPDGPTGSSGRAQ